MDGWKTIFFLLGPGLFSGGKLLVCWESNLKVDLVIDGGNTAKRETSWLHFTDFLKTKEETYQP